MASHNSRQSCWVLLYDQVYDVTDFLDQHPGGANAILRYAGRDATSVYDPIHPEGTLAGLKAYQKLGPVDISTLTEDNMVIDEKEERSKQDTQRQLPLNAILNLGDFEENAERLLSSKAWAYYRSAADDERTYDANLAAYTKLYFRPRILVNVSRINLRTKLLGFNSALPIFTSPAALARLSHQDGERGIGLAAGRRGIIQVLSQHSSHSLQQVAEARLPDQPLFFQLYCLKVDADTIHKIQEAKKAGFQAFWITVDTASSGIRTRDERHKNMEALRLGENLDNALSVAGGNSVNQTDKTDWNELQWIMQEIGPETPVVLKGIQCVEDAIMAKKAGVRGIVVSNHGGRNLGSAIPSLYVLYEIYRYAPFLISDPDFDIFVDGGIRRGSDVIKALCLGATAVGVGRPALYALVGYGQKGVEHMLDILRAECESVMRLLGVPDVKDLGIEYLNTRQLERDVMLDGMESRVGELMKISKL